MAIYTSAYTGAEIDAALARAINASNPNAIHNGNFAVNQRAVSGTVTLAAGVYGHDRWKAGAAGCTYTFTASGGVTTLTISAGTLIQVIEGVNLETATYCLSWTGTAQGKIGAGTAGASGVTGSVTGGTNLNIEFGAGTLAKVKLEQGAVATPFIFEDYGEQLALCQRYFQVVNRYGTTYAYPAVGIAYSTTQVIVTIPLPVSLRAAPTITASGTWTLFQTTDISIGTLAAGVAVTQGCIDRAVVLTAAATGLTAGTLYNLRTANSGRIQMSADL